MSLMGSDGTLCAVVFSHYAAALITRVAFFFVLSVAFKT